MYILKKHKCHISTKSIYAGLRTTYWPGRLEKLQDNPKIVVDVAHNHQAVDNLFNDITSIFNYKRLIVLVGFLRDKNVSDMAKLISEYADYVFVTTPNSDRALNGDSLVQEFLKNSITAINIDKEYKAVLNFAKSDDLVCVTGSFYVVGDFLNFYKKA